MNLMINGVLGQMGQEVVKLCGLGYRGACFAVGVDPEAQKSDTGTVIYRTLNEVVNFADIDCIIDFSHHASTSALVLFARENKLPVVICTTGHTDEELSFISRLSDVVPVFISANMSLGVALLVELAKTAALAMPEAEIEIIEKHHNRKIDAPSGTALMIADAICDVRPNAYTNLGRSGQDKRTAAEIGIHAVRMGNIVGEHEVIIGTENQTITLKHEAHSRALFAEGALAAAEFIIGRDAGLYDMKSLVSGEVCSINRSFVEETL